MNKSLRVLHVEDSERDLALLTRHLTRAGYDLVAKRVDTAEAMRASLGAQEWDFILCDYSMPHFNALAALALLKGLGLDIPFVIISGTIGEDVAVEAMRAGAHDYLMKDKLTRLVPTIERELLEAENRRARRQAEVLYRRLIDTTFEGVWMFDAEMRTSYVNLRLAEMLGVNADEMIGRSSLDFVHEDSRADVQQRLQRRTKGIKEQYDLRLRRADGSDLWVIVCATPILGKQDEFTGSLSMLTDITQRKQTEQLVRLQATALESADNAILITDSDGAITWANSAFTALTGYTREEVLNRNPRILKSGKHEPPFYASMWKTLLSGKVWHGEIVNRRKDGAIYVEEETITPVLNDAGEITNFIAIKQDITGRKQAEEERVHLTVQIENQRQRLDNIVASVPGVVWEAWGEPVAATQRIDFVSEYVETMLGYSVEDWLSTPNFWLSIVHPADREQLAIDAAADFAKGGSNNTQEFRWIAKDGRVLWVQSISVVIRDDDGNPVGLRGVTIDITERKRTDERRAVQHAVDHALANSVTLVETKPNILRAICETVGWVWSALWTVDGDANLLRCREIWRDPLVDLTRFEQVTRESTLAPGEGLPGRVWADVHPEWISDVTRDQNSPRAQIAATENLHSALAIPIRSGSTVLGVMEFLSSEIREPDPELLAMMATVSNQIGQFIERERTEEALKKSEEQLRQSQKMEAIGQLAGGIAHDFNNLLTVITGYSDLSIRKLQGEDPLRRNLEEIKKAGDRAATLTRQLLAFSRKQVLQPKVLDLNSVVTELEKMLRRLIGEDIELLTMLTAKLGSVKADPGQIEQIVMNLVVNARDVMPDGGKLTIETKNVDLDDDYATQHIAVTPGPYVMLAVTDTGTGMDKQTQSRIFEPFFTTKEAGKGTGLGLSTVYGIVKQSGGLIWVYSEVGQGTTFKIYLPRVGEGAQEYERDAEAKVDTLGTETILVAEDEEMVRKLACEVLEAYGYRVLEAANGGVALLICERENEPIDLLITDVVMPEMSGRELSDRLAGLRPKMKVLYMSGYTDNAIVHQGVLDEDADFIQKPFSPGGLTRKVRGVLDAKGQKVDD